MYFIAEVDAYLNKAYGNTFRSMHSTKKVGGGTELGAKTQSRTSQQIWINDLSDEINQLFTPEAVQVSYRVRNATLMNVFGNAGGEFYQVANYGIGKPINS